jgi:hypothetical protein
VAFASTHDLVDVRFAFERYDTVTAVFTPAPPTLDAVTPWSGVREGDIAIASGTNLTSGNSFDITVNGVRVEQLTAISDREISFVVPAGRGSASVVVTNLYGESEARAMSYASGPPELLDLDPPRGSTMGGTTVRISGNDLHDVVEVFFGTRRVGWHREGGEIVATAPVGHQPVEVSVVAFRGSERLLSNPLVFAFDGPELAVTSTSPSVIHSGDPSGIGEGPTTVMLNGSGFTGADRVDLVTGTFQETISGSRLIVLSDTQIALDGVWLGKEARDFTVDALVHVGDSVSPRVASDKIQYIQDRATIEGLSPASGRREGGEQVTIIGRSFLGTTSVVFGDTAAQFRVVNARTIEAIAPPGNSFGRYSVDVRVVNNKGASPIVPADQYTYNSLDTD